MDVGERSIVDMIVKVIEEGKLLNLKYSGWCYIWFKFKCANSAFFYL